MKKIPKYIVSGSIANADKIIDSFTKVESSSKELFEILDNLK